MIKCFHLLFVLAFSALLILSSVLMILVARKDSGLVAIHRRILNALDHFIPTFMLLAIVTGSLLVHQKGYSFGTPWIKAASIYTGWLLVAWCGFALWRRRALRSEGISRLFLCCFPIIYFVFFLVVGFVAHDAVTKMTELPIHVVF